MNVIGEAIAVERAEPTGPSSSPLVESVLDDFPSQHLFLLCNVFFQK